MSDRAKRMARRNKKGKRTVALNLVSLMDIFTILVFFLLVNSQQVEVLPNAKDLGWWPTLPMS
jgi:biopolymer transport protein ExbD